MGARAARGVARGGREVEIFMIRAEILVLQGAELVVRVQEWVVPTLGRALHKLEQTRAAWRVAGRRGRPLACVTKLRFFAIQPNVPDVGAGPADPYL